MSKAASCAPPPRNVAHRRALPAAVSFATKASEGAACGGAGGPAGGGGGGGVPPGMHEELVLQPRRVAAVDEVDPLVEVPIDDLVEAPDVPPPLGGVVPEEEVVPCRQGLRPRPGGGAPPP